MTTPGLSDLILLRLAINDEGTGDDQEFGDALLIDFLNRNSNSVNAAAADLWGVKAGRMATLVRVSEAGATRENQQLLTNAQLMAKQFRALADAADAAVTTVAAPFVVQIERP